MRRGQYILAYVLAALVMMYASYSVPRWLPGDFVTAMYSSSHVTLNAEQEADLRAYYTERHGFGRYLVDFFTLHWGYSYAFLTPISGLISASFAVEPPAPGHRSSSVHDLRIPGRRGGGLAPGRSDRESRGRVHDYPGRDSGNRDRRDPAAAFRPSFGLASGSRR